MHRIVDLLHGKKRYCVAGEDRRIGAIAVQQARDIYANTQPYRKGHQQKVACLREYPRYGNRGRDADDSRNQAKTGLLQDLAARGLRKDGDGQYRRRWGFEFEPKAQIQRNDSRYPDPDRESPRGQWKAPRTKSASISHCHPLLQIRYERNHPPPDQAGGSGVFARATASFPLSFGLAPNLSKPVEMRNAPHLQTLRTPSSGKNTDGMSKSVVSESRQWKPLRGPTRDVSLPSTHGQTLLRDGRAL